MAKRGNGEGSIFKRANGRWYSALTYRDDFGEVKRREVSGRTQAEVRAKLRELRERVEAGAPVKDAWITMAAWLEDWTTKALPASDRKQATIDLYATIARSHLVPKLGSLPLDRLRPSDVEALVLAKRRAGLSASSVRTIYAVLRAALDVAVRDGLIQRNPAALVKRPAVERKDAGYLSAQQAEALLEAVRGDRLEALYRVMLATGLRRGEALALHWRDVDLDAAVVRVRWTLSRTSAGLELGEPKTEKSRRTVPLPVPAVETLRAHRKRQAAEQLAAGSLWQASGLVFTSEIGTPLEPRNVLRRFEALAERAGLRGVHLHTLRHSAASFLLAAGTHTKVVQEHLGHSSYAITADIYSHVAPAQQREAADKLGQAIHW
jgi:integrase